MHAEQTEHQVERLEQALEKLGDEVDKRTGHKYSAQIDKAVDVAQERTGDGDHVK